MTTATERIEVAGYEVSPDHFIGGERVASERRFEDISPIDGDVIGEVSRASEADVDRAVHAANAAFPIGRTSVQPDAPLTCAVSATSSTRT